MTFQQSNCFELILKSQVSLKVSIYLVSNRIWYQTSFFQSLSISNVIIYPTYKCIQLIFTFHSKIHDDKFWDTSSNLQYSFNERNYIVKMITVQFNNSSRTLNICASDCIFQLQQSQYVKKFSGYICQNKVVFLFCYFWSHKSLNRE